MMGSFCQRVLTTLNEERFGGDREGHTHGGRRPFLPNPKEKRTTQIIML